MTEPMPDLTDQDRAALASYDALAPNEPEGDELYLASIYGVCAVCGAARRVLTTTSPDGRTSTASLVCGANPNHDQDTHWENITAARKAKREAENAS